MSVLNVINHLALPLPMADPTPDVAVELLHRLFDHDPTISLRIRVWDGHQVVLGIAPQSTLVFKDAGTFARCFGTCDPSEFAVAYADGHLDVEGDLHDAIAAIVSMRCIDSSGEVRESMKASLGLTDAPSQADGAENDQRAGRSHYDQPIEFFQLFLDVRMSYSSAYFAAPSERLDDAQARKLDLICQKLDLSASDRFLDIGCGWGSLVIWAARRYGVRAHGITSSHEEAAEALRRVEKAGVGDLVTIGVADAHELPERAFNKIAAISAYEHVGPDQIGPFFDAVKRALLPGGLFLNHGVTAHEARGDRTGRDFIRTRVFPGASVKTLATLEHTLERTGFEILDVQALRPHCALTLHAWSRRLHHARSAAVAMTSERVVRTWEAFFGGAALAFDSGLIGVHQIVAAIPDAAGRAHAPLQRRA